MMQSLSNEILDMAVRVQQIPAPTFAEAERARFVCEQFQGMGLLDVEIDPISNVYGRLPGMDSGAYPPVVVSAHLDTVFPASTPLDVTRQTDRIYGPGIGDNSLAVAGLIGLAQMVQALPQRLPGDLWLAANVGEEGLGDLNGMNAVVDRFGNLPAAYVVLEGTALGHIYHQGLSVRRYRICFTTIGGHSWANFGRPSAIHEMAKFISGLEDLDIPVDPRTTYNAGVISGGASVNTIAAEASMELDLRSESPEALDSLIGQVEAQAKGFVTEDVNVSLEMIGNRPGGSVAPDHPLVRLASTSIESIGMTPQLKIGSTDANAPLSRGLPAICIGISTGGGAHTVGEYIDTAPVEKGMKHVMDVVVGVWER